MEVRTAGAGTPLQASCRTRRWWSRAATLSYSGLALPPCRLQSAPPPPNLVWPPPYGACCTAAGVGPYRRLPVFSLSPFSPSSFPIGPQLTPAARCVLISSTPSLSEDFYSLFFCFCGVTTTGRPFSSLPPPHSMGAAYSSLVFRPPAVTYEVDSDGKIMFVRRVGGGRMAPATEPVVWLRTARGSVIPAVYLAVEGAETVLLMSHTNAEVRGVDVSSTTWRGGE